MDARRHLQPALFDMPGAQPMDEWFGELRGLKPDDSSAYPGAWGGSPLDVDIRPNPLPQRSGNPIDVMPPSPDQRDESEEFIPPWKVTSHQGAINQDAVNHQVQNANPLALDEDPFIVPYEEGGEERYHVWDGNHRVNAAQERGQLLMPARVMRGR